MDTLLIPAVNSHRCRKPSICRWFSWGFPIVFPRLRLSHGNIMGGISSPDQPARHHSGDVFVNWFEGLAAVGDLLIDIVQFNRFWQANFCTAIFDWSVSWSILGHHFDLWLPRLLRRASLYVRCLCWPAAFGQAWLETLNGEIRDSRGVTIMVIIMVYTIWLFNIAMENHL